MATLSGRRVTDLELTIPPAGAWLCSGHLDSGDPMPAGTASLTIGDLTLTGSILPGRGGSDAPAFPSFVLAGGAGWKTSLPAPGASYSSAAGVRLTTVLRDLAAIAGELYQVPPEVSLGSAYGWDASTPQRPLDCGEVLADLVARGALPLWRVAVGARDVAANGRTVFAPWPSWGPADAHGVVSNRELARGVRMVKLSTSVAAWLPGATLQGATITRVTFIERGGELHARVTATAPSLLTSTRKAVVRLFPWIARIGTAASGALGIRSDAGRIELEGGGPAVARVGDLVVRVFFDKTQGLWISFSPTAPYVWTAVPVSLVPPTTADAGVAITITTGSGKVTCG